MKMMSRSFLYLALSCVLFLGFQNCTQPSHIKFSDKSEKTVSTDSESGNGGGYEGKLTFVHLEPGFTCENKSAPRSVLRRNENNLWFLTVNQKEKCLVIDHQSVNDVIYNGVSGRVIYQNDEYMLDTVAPWDSPGLIDYVREFKVTPAADANSRDVQMGDGVCANSAGLCSLSAAVDELNSTPLKSSIVLVEAGTYLLAQALAIKVLSASWIKGVDSNQTILDGNGLTSLFNIDTSSIQISHMKLVNGRNPLANGSGGAMYSINSQLSISNCIIENNYAAMWGGGVSAGRGNLYIRRSQFINNKLSSVMGIHQGDAIGSARNHELIIEESEITDHANPASTYGVIYSQNDDSIVIRNSLIYNNSIPGPAISLRNVIENISVENSTVAMNSGTGIAALLGPAVLRGSFRIANSTFIENLSNMSIQADDPTNLSITNSAFSKISGNNCGSSANLNIFSKNNSVAGVSCGFSDPGSILVGSLGLSPSPVSSGGWSRVFLPQVGSPLIDSGDNQSCLAMDQRGQMRPVDSLGGGAFCDIGAVEVGP